jgi:hypothetical protein
MCQMRVSEAQKGPGMELRGDRNRRYKSSEATPARSEPATLVALGAGREAVSLVRMSSSLSLSDERCASELPSTSFMVSLDDPQEPKITAVWVRKTDGQKENTREREGV